VALHVAAIDGNVRGVVVWDMPVSFLSLLEEERYSWPADAFFPNVLVNYDLPELAGVAGCPVAVINAKDGKGAVLPVGRAREIYGEHVRVESHPGEPEKNGAIVQSFRRILG